MQSRSQLNGSDLEVVAAELCATIFGRGSASGRFTIGLTELRRLTALPLDRLEAATAWATQHAWMRSDRDHVELSAAGIYVAKVTLDLPR